MADFLYYQLNIAIRFHFAPDNASFVPNKTIYYLLKSYNIFTVPEQEFHNGVVKSTDTSVGAEPAIAIIS